MQLPSWMGGGDVIRAGAGHDTICASGGNGVVRGGSDGDSLDDITGDDALFGGRGRDLLTFVGEDRGVDVDLGAGTATGPGSDTVQSVSDVFGTDYVGAGENADEVFAGKGRDQCMNAETMKGAKLDANGGRAVDAAPRPADQRQDG